MNGNHLHVARPARPRGGRDGEDAPIAIVRSRLNAGCAASSLCDAYRRR